MRRYFILTLLFLFSLNILISKSNIKDISILIVPFQNCSFSEEYDYIRYIIYDVTLNFLKDNRDFIIEDSFDKIELGVLKEDEIVKKCKLQNISLIITGFFIKIDKDTKVVIKIIDPKKGKTIITEEFINKNIDNLQGDFLNTLKVVFKNIVELNVSKENKIKEKNFINNLVSEEFIFLKIGISYSIMPNILINKDVTNDYDINGFKNNYQNNIRCYYNLEYYKLYKDNFYGFGLGFSLPYEINIPRFSNIGFFDFSFVFGYKKIFFFKWSFEVNTIFFNIYSENPQKSKNKYNINNLNMSSGFNFRYLNDKYNFYIESGFTLIPFLFGLKSGGENDIGINKISISKDINNNSFIVPVILNFEIAKFLNKEVGVFIRTILSFYYFDYYSRFYRNWIKDAGEYTYSYDLGDTFSLNITIISGFTFKTLYK